MPAQRLAAWFMPIPTLRIIPPTGPANTLQRDRGVRMLGSAWRCMHPFPGTVRGRQPWHGRAFLLRDRDRIFGFDFTNQVKELGIREVLGAPRTPQQRAYIERGTTRR